MKFPTVRQGLGWITIPEMVKRSAEKYGDRIALQMRREGEWVTYTFNDMLDRVSRLSTYLRSVGIEKGDRISVVGENRPEWALSYLAGQWTGAVLVPLDPRLSPTEWRHILRDAGVKLVIASRRFVSDFLEIKRDLKELKIVVSMDSYKTDPSVKSLPEIWDEVKDPSPMESVSLDDLAVILYTSGTTGTSKGVMLTQKNIMSNVDSVYQILDFGPGDVFFSILPLHHVFEATAGFITPLYGGATIVYARSLKPNEMREDMYETKPTLFLVVPLLLEKILKGIYREVRRASVVKKGLFRGLFTVGKGLKPIFGRKIQRALFKSIREKTGFGNARYIISGGAALPRAVSKPLEDMGFPIYQGYGLSESAPVLTVNPPSRPKNESVGLPIPGVEIKIKDPNPDGIGEIMAKGPNIMKGYYKNENATKEVLTPDGWLLTGDLGYLDEEGYLYITGRKKSVIVTRGGKNIYPEEIEERLMESPFIEEVLVIMGVHPKTGEEELQAIVYPNYENLDEYFIEHKIENPTEKDIINVINREIERISKDLADYKRPRRFMLREEEFPKTTTRKIKRYLFEKPPIELK